MPCTGFCEIPDHIWAVPDGIQFHRQFLIRMIGKEQNCFFQPPPALILSCQGFHPSADIRLFCPVIRKEITVSRLDLAGGEQIVLICFPQWIVHLQNILNPHFCQELLQPAFGGLGYIFAGINGFNDLLRQRFGFFFLPPFPYCIGRHLLSPPPIKVLSHHTRRNAWRRTPGWLRSAHHP